jgi:hypothetical protein
MTQELMTEERKRLLDTLGEDVLRCLESRERDKAGGEFWDRMIVRSSFAYHEALAFILREWVQDDHKNGGISLNQRELDVLAEEQYEPDQTGRLQLRGARFPTANFIAFSIRMFAKACGVSDKDLECQVFGAQGWQAFRTVMKVRDRLSHPKAANALVLSKQEFDSCADAAIWVHEVLHFLKDSAERHLGGTE